MDKIVITAPLSIQVHLGNPKMARIPELSIKVMPECEGGGWYMPTGEAEALVAAWNGFTSHGDPESSELPTWAQLVGYWKQRAEVPPQGFVLVPVPVSNLLIAAPDMLSLLKEAAEFVQPFNRAADFLARIEAAISKAEAS